MAGDVKIKVVSGALATGSSATTDFTDTDFGTPKACIVLISGDTSDNVLVSAFSRASIGFSDFTNHFCIAHQDEDNSAKVDCDAVKSNTTCGTMLSGNGSITRTVTASTVTDGVRLTNNAVSSSAFLVTVIMFGGADLAADALEAGVNSSEDSGTTFAPSGMVDSNDKLVFFIGTDLSGFDSASTGIENSFGVCHVTGSDGGGWTFVQRCMGWSSDHNNAAGSPASVIRNNRCLSITEEDGTQDWGLEVTALSVSGGTITTTTRDNGAGAGMEVMALVLDLDDRSAKVGSVDSPTSGATWSPSVSLGFTPQYVGLGLTQATAEGTIETDADAGSVGVSSNTGSSEESCHSWYNEDAAPDTNANSLFRSRVIDFRTDDIATVVQDHSHSSFDSGGWTYTINTENETTARKWFYWTIEEAGAPTPYPDEFLVQLFDPTQLRM